MTNLELYKIFVLVANEGNITHASEKLNLTQPAITKHIKNLENILQLKLFTRSNHGIKLTKQGEILYNEIKDAINLIISVDKKYIDIKNINVGSHTTILNKEFSKCVSDYYIKNPKSKINRFNFDNDDMLLKLKNRELDIIFSKRIVSKYENENIRFIKLGLLNDVLIANKNSKFRNKKVTLEDIKKENIYMPRKTSETTRNFFESVNCQYDYFDNINYITYKTIIEILKNNEGVGLVTKEFLEEMERSSIIILDTEFKIEPIEFGIYINKNNNFMELNQFIKIIKNNFKTE